MSSSSSSSSSLVLSSHQLMIQQIHETILQELGAIHVEVLDESSSKSRCEGGAKLKILVVSEQFTNVSLLQRHRKVNTAVKEYMKYIHALTIQAYTRTQYDAILTQQQENNTTL